MRLQISFVAILLVVRFLGPGTENLMSQTQDQGAAKGVSTAVAEFNKAFAALKQVNVDLQKIRAAYQSADEAGRAVLEKDYEKRIASGRALYPTVLPLAEKAFADSPQKEADHTQFILSETNTAVGGGDLKKAHRLFELLFSQGIEEKGLRTMAAMTAMACDDYKAAELHLQKSADTEGKLSAAGQKIKRELKARIDDAEAGDLPIIKMETSKGEITIELFEKEAPNTVANFVSLVEKKFYDGIVFHRVIDGFMAQGGDPTGTGGGGPGHNIPCECYAKNHREHFAGTLSMAHAGKDTGGSQFFLTFVPTDHLDGKHTVFGRVTKGFDVLAKLNRIQPGQPGVKPDKMTKVTVVRKREHEYQPKTTPER